MTIIIKKIIKRSGIRGWELTIGRISWLIRWKATSRRPTSNDFQNYKKKAKKAKWSNLSWKSSGPISSSLMVPWALSCLMSFRFRIKLVNGSIRMLQYCIRGSVLKVLNSARDYCFSVHFQLKQSWISCSAVRSIKSIWIFFFSSNDFYYLNMLVECLRKHPRARWWFLTLYY